MTQAANIKCAICRTAIELRPQNAYFPFCSARCKQVDLGRWLNEEYSFALTQTSTERSLPDRADSSDDGED